MGISQNEGVEAVLFGSDLGTEGQVLTLGATSQVTTELTEGLYKVCATEACWVKQGASSVAAAEATAANELIPAGFVRYFAVTNPTVNGYVAAIQAAGAGGYASITRQDRR